MCRGLLLIMHSTITMWRERETDNHTDGYRNGTQHTPRHTTRVADIYHKHNHSKHCISQFVYSAWQQYQYPWVHRVGSDHTTLLQRGSKRATEASPNHRSSSRTSIRPRGPVSINQCSLVFLFSGEKKKNGKDTRNRETGN